MVSSRKLANVGMRSRPYRRLLAGISGRLGDLKIYTNKWDYFFSVNCSMRSQIARCADFRDDTIYL